MRHLMLFESLFICLMHFANFDCIHILCTREIAVKFYVRYTAYYIALLQGRVEKHNRLSSDYFLGYFKLEWKC